MTVYVGTSGWSYDHWGGVLYPAGASARVRFERYVAEFSTVEVNSSFYHWPRNATFAGWKSRLPQGFRFSVKAPRGLTHGRRLGAAQQPKFWGEVPPSDVDVGPRRQQRLMHRCERGLTVDEHLHIVAVAGNTITGHPPPVASSGRRIQGIELAKTP